MHPRFVLPLVTSLLLSSACPPEKEEPEPIDFATTPLAGTINGAPWTFEGGGTDAFLSDEDGFFTDFFGEAEADVCNPTGTTAPRILTQLPTEVGEVRMGFSNNLTFSYEDENGDLQNDVAVSGGGFRIDEIDEAGGTISGAIKASTNGHEVDGEFTVTICP